MTPTKSVKCVVVPARPPIDKLIAFKRVRLDLQDTFRICVAFCDVNIPTPEHHARWDAMCSDGVEAYLIDIGEKKYHKGAGSAAEVEKMSSDTDSGRTWNRLVELANENNASGKLKSARHSVAKIIRDAYEIMNGGEGSQELVFDHGMEVVDGFFLRQNSRGWQELFDKEEYCELRKLWDGFAVSEKEVLPFTLPLYFRQLFLSGRSVQEISQKIGWWLDKVRRIAERRQTAQQRRHEFYGFPVAGKEAGVIKVEDAFDAEAATFQLVGSGKIAIGVLRNKRGHVHIQSSFLHLGANFNSLAKTLEQLEPGLWYYETRFAGPMLMNGSRQFTGVTPTNLSDQDLMRLINSHVTFGQ